MVSRPAARSAARDGATATCIGLLDPIRKAFANANGVKPALFSANSESACATTATAPASSTPTWAMMAGVATTCEGFG